MKSISTETITIPTTDSHPIAADLYKPEDARGICILCHGFKGHRKWGFLPYLAENISRHGISALSIDFSHNGTIGSNGSPGQNLKDEDPYIEPDLFRKNTLGREISDLSCVINSITRDGLGGRLDGKEPIGLFGHSRGGLSAILNSIKHDRVKALCTWSIPTHPDIFSQEQKRKWKEKGFIEFTDSALNIPLAVDRIYLDDIERNYDEYDMEKALTKLKIPYLLVHGTIDVPVSPDAALRLYRAAGSSNDKRLFLIKSGHTFGVGPHFSKPSDALKRAVEETAMWFKKHLH